MNDRQIKLAIEELKKEVSNLNYYINNVVSLPKDKTSFKNLTSAQLSAIHISRIVEKEISLIERVATANLDKEQHSKFRENLGSINKPDKAMKKNAENFLNSIKKPNQLMKTSIMEQIKKASGNNVKTKDSSMGNG